MSTFSIAIIKENKVRLNESDKNEKNLTNDNLESLLEDYIEFKKVSSNNEMMEVIAKILDQTLNYHITTSTCYVDYDYVYQICHLESKDDKKVNYIARTLLSDEYYVVRDCIMLKAKLDNKLNFVNDNITIEDIIDVYRKMHKHTGLKIFADGEIKETTYYHNPMDGLTPDDVKNLKFHEFQLATNRVAQVFIEMEPRNNKFNELASIFYGQPIYGDVLVGIRNRGDNIFSSSTLYLDITKHYFHKLLCIRSVDDLKVEDDASIIEKKQLEMEQKEVSNTPKLIFFEHFVETKYASYKRKYGEKYSTKKLEKMKDMQPLHEYTKEQLKGQSKEELKEELIEKKSN